MSRKKLEELNLLDDFLLESIVSNPLYGELFCRRILEIIFCRKFGKLRIVPQKTYPGVDTDKHGVRLDVYIEEDGEDMARAAVYDVEVESEFKRQQLEGIAKRVRFYRAMIDAVSLKAGTNYKQLKKVTVLMIVPFDPFGKDRMVYTIRNMCEELPDMPYDDGARTVFLYTRGTGGNPPKELRQLLQYMEHSVEENAQTPVLQELHRMVKHVKQDGEVGVRYMKIFEREQMIREEAMGQGLEQGLEQGVLLSISNLMQSLNYTVDQAMDTLLIPKGEQENYRMQLLDGGK